MALIVSEVTVHNGGKVVVEKFTSLWMGSCSIHIMVDRKQFSSWQAGSSSVHITADREQDQK